MSSIPDSKEDNNAIIGDGIHITGQSQKASTSQGNDGKPQQSESKTEEATKSTSGLVNEANKSDALTSAAASTSAKQSDDNESEEIKSKASTSTVSVEAVESPEQKPTGSAGVQPTSGRILLKRRRSRLSMPTIVATRSVAEEVDSAPRPSKKRTPKKRMIALFLESDYPSRK